MSHHAQPSCIHGYPAELKLDDSNFFDSIKSIVRSWSNICCLLFIRSEQGVAFDYFSVVEIFHSLFDQVLGGLDIYNEYKCVIVFCLHGRLSGEMMA